MIKLIKKSSLVAFSVKLHNQTAGGRLFFSEAFTDAGNFKCKVTLSDFFLPNSFLTDRH